MVLLLYLFDLDECLNAVLEEWLMHTEVSCDGLDRGPIVLLEVVAPELTFLLSWQLAFDIRYVALGKHLIAVKSPLGTHYTPYLGQGGGLVP